MVVVVVVVVKLQNSVTNSTYVCVFINIKQMALRGMKFKSI